MNPPEPFPSMDPRSRRHILTIGLEDYFQVAAFQRVIQSGQWHRFERTVERGTRRTLDLLAEHGVQATFFVLGWVADEYPELVAEVSEAGHEVASKGYYHRNIQLMTPAEFREDLQRSRNAIEAATGKRVMGYRVADRWFVPEDLWALGVLAEEGYRYDSSLALIGRRFSSEPWRRFVHTHIAGERRILEVPISSTSWFGQHIPVAGGTYFRQFPGWMIRRAVDSWHRSYTAPFVMYVHTWEMDSNQPRIDAAPWLQRLRHYRNLTRMPERVAYFLSRYQFTSVASHQGFSISPIEPQGSDRRRKGEKAPSQPATPLPVEVGSRASVSVVVPCYNEEVVIPYLKNTLDAMVETLEDRFDFRFVFVDDASTDRTWGMLKSTFGTRPNCQILRRERNGGVARAVLTGMLAAETGTVCSIDCDCSYDPIYLGSMIPLLEEGVDLVTASPYHPQGGVRNVPGWRLILSKTLSRMYRVVLDEDLHTFTACFRVYRREAFLSTGVDRGGYLGVAEMLGRLSLGGGRIREFPAVLETRVMGHSKMKVLRTIFGHLGLVAQLAWIRLRKGKRRPEAASGREPELQGEDAGGRPEAHG